MKNRIPYLTSTEYSFMTILWNSERPLSVSEILDKREDGTWAKNSVHPLLNSLLEKGFLQIQGTVKATKANSRLYGSKISLSEYTSSQVDKVFKKNKLRFNIPAFLSNFLGSDENLNDELVNELEEWLTNYNSEKDENK